MIKTARTLVIGLMTVALAMLGFGLTASATHVAPTLILGNPSCDGGVKIDPVPQGTTTIGNLTIVVSGKTFSFSTTGGSTVSDVIVKGGPNANWYHYDPATTGDTGLQAPDNKQGSPSGLSHLCFSIDDKQFPDPDPK